MLKFSKKRIFLLAIAFGMRYTRFGIVFFYKGGVKGEKIARWMRGKRKCELRCTKYEVEGKGNVSVFGKPTPRQAMYNLSAAAPCGALAGQAIYKVF